MLIISLCFLLPIFTLAAPLQSKTNNLYPTLIHAELKPSFKPVNILDNPEIGRSRRARTNHFNHIKRQEEPSPAEEESNDQVPVTKEENNETSSAVSTETTKVEPESQPTTIEDGLTNSQSEYKSVMVLEAIEGYNTDRGRVIEKCLVPSDDSSQGYCESWIDGKLQENDESLVAPSVTTSASFTQSTSEAQPEPTGTSLSSSEAEISESFFSCVPTFSASESSSLSTFTETLVTATQSAVDVMPTIYPINLVDDSGASTEVSSSIASPISFSLMTPTSTESVSTTEFTEMPSATTEDSIVVETIASSAFANATVAAASETAAAVAIPGQQIKVLPIGLGILGGLVGIAVAAVLYVTLQKRKYRKEFRSRKLAEEASPMGFSGNYGSAELVHRLLVYIGMAMYHNCIRTAGELP
ncbi:uncharacterized protein L201_002578 [Kwoniella dendrophila CBS 6074]|uniref:Mid2 domain-containing protein n=1 Tax=Kwoniella dendrophila CBS 6074 TaxID=1295534 RepID=A0AAX4JQK9_9TREE